MNEPAPARRPATGAQNDAGSQRSTMNEDVRQRPTQPGGDRAAPASGPRRVASLRARRSPLAEPQEQLRLLAELDLRDAAGEPATFAGALARAGLPELRPVVLEIFQINLGRLCNMSCRHCHVDAGPDRWDQTMDRETVDACLAALDRTAARTVDLTGGAPEMNPNFRYLVEACVARGVHVMDRCNLTVLLVPKHRDLPAWLAERGVEMIGSLPHYAARNTDAQRGEGAFERSLTALRRLNAAGYGQGDPRRRLTLVANPAGAFLAPRQSAVESEWRRRLARDHGVTFDRLIALNNMPIARFLEWLEESGNLQSYLEKLVASFNPGTVAGLMCRNTISVGWDGRVHDCDFNQMLGIDATDPQRKAFHIRDFDPEAFAARRIRTARHCFGCTAGAGSSCGGALD